jgi:hypothetical protein
MSTLAVSSGAVDAAAYLKALIGVSPAVVHNAAPSVLTKSDNPKRENERGHLASAIGAEARASHFCPTDRSWHPSGEGSVASVDYNTTSRACPLWGGATCWLPRDHARDDRPAP